MNRDLGFSDEDRAESIRRVAEVASLFLKAGVIVISAFITPNEQLRSTVRSVIGDDLIEVYVRCSFEKCRARDVKGLYAKAAAGQIAQFTSRGALVDRSCLRSSLASATASGHGETTATVPARQ